MKPATEWIRTRLRFKIVVEGSQIAPTGISAQLNQGSTDQQAEKQPTKKPNHRDRGRTLRKWPRIKKWCKKDCQKPSLAELRFPAVTVPFLANVVYRQVKEPQNRENDRVPEPQNHRTGERKSGPGDHHQGCIRMVEPKDRGKPPECGPIGTQSFMNPLQEKIKWQKAVKSN